MLFEDRFEANRLPSNSASVPLDSVNLWCYCGFESGRRTGQRNDRPERRLRPQGPRSRHQIRRIPRDILSPAYGTSLKSQNRAWPIRSFPKTRWLAPISKIGG